MTRKVPDYLLPWLARAAAGGEAIRGPLTPCSTRQILGTLTLGCCCLTAYARMYVSVYTSFGKLDLQRPVRSISCA